MATGTRGVAIDDVTESDSTRARGVGGEHLDDHAGIAAGATGR
ncbi:MAG TPA: hypothetical protein VGO30_00870 [Mycobacterium sp.]|jgi:hypothetical protein|nr:hypothetical protein [Mycobacterium sp.]